MKSNVGTAPDFERQLRGIERTINRDPLKAYEQLHALRRKEADASPRLLYYCEILLGRCQQRMGQYTRAYGMIEKSVRKLEALGAKREAALGYHYLSQIDAARNDLVSAQENCLHGLKIAKAIRDWFLQMNLYIDLCPVYNGYGDYRSGLNCYLRSKAIFENHLRGKDVSVADNEEYTAFIIDLNIAILYHMSRDYEKSIESLDRISDAAYTVFDGMYVDQYHIEYAHACFGANRDDEALQHVDVLIQRLEENRNAVLHGIPMNCLVLCQTLLQRGMPDRAYRLIKLVEHAAEKENDPRIMGKIHYLLALYSRSKNDVLQANEHFARYAEYNDIFEERRQQRNRQSAERRMRLQTYLDKQEKLEERYRKEKEALAIAEQASAAKGSFMSRMSHEIRTPLNAIIGYNTVASSDISAAQTDAELRLAAVKVADSLKKSSIASRHLLAIINDVLDMAAIESGKVKLSHERFDFQELIRSLTAIFYIQAASEGVDFEVVFDAPTEEWFVGDLMRISQILTNLLSNAVKFTQDGGEVRLMIRQTEDTGNTARLRFEVSDTGIGMSPEYLEHIWTPFEQEDASISRRFGGTGLGMSITKNLVELMGGTIAVESQPGKGTAFTVDLRLERTEQPGGDRANDFQRVNALVIDDDPDTRGYICLLMERLGARCASAASGCAAVEAVAAAKRNNEPYTVCLLDWRVPNADMPETIRQITAAAGNAAPAIVLTAYDITEVTDMAAKNGVDRFLTKPLFQSSLHRLLSELVDAHAEKKHDKSAVSARFAGERVLLAEDNAMNMEIARRILELAGLTVDSAWNGREAVKLFESAAPGTYQAILMDVQMPVMDGHAATRKIRACAHPEAKTVPILAMTADVFTENISEALAAGMNDHIAKPIDLPTLFEILGKYIKTDQAAE